MHLDRLKPAWKQFKSEHSFNLMPHEEVLRLIETPRANKSRTVLVHVMMLVVFLMACY